MLNKIFQIGYSKTGTVSLFRFFTDNRIPSIHHGGGALAATMIMSVAEGAPLLREYPNYRAYFDMQGLRDGEFAQGYLLFDKLDEEHPGSRFILNTRPASNWLRSYARYFNVLARMLAALDLDEAGLLKQREAHHARVLDYFRARPSDLLVFDIEADDGQKLCDFFADELPNLDPRLWGKHHATPAKGWKKGYRGPMTDPPGSLSVYPSYPAPKTTAHVVSGQGRK